MMNEIKRLEYLLTSKFDQGSQTKELLQLLRKVELDIFDDSVHRKLITKHHFVKSLVTSSPSILTNASIIDAVFRILSSFFNKSVSKHIRQLALVDFINNGGFIFAMNALKSCDIVDIKISSLCTNVLSQGLTFISTVYNLNSNTENSKSQKNKNEKGHDDVPIVPKKTPMEIMNQLVLHGATSVLPKFLYRFASKGKEESCLAVIKTFQFLIVNTPPAITVSITRRLANVSNSACIQALLLILRNSPSLAAVDAATLLLCMVANSEDLAISLKRDNGWDDISSIVAGNMSALRARVSSSWLLKAQQRVAALLQSDEQQSSLVNPALEAIQSSLAELLLGEEEEEERREDCSYSDDSDTHSHTSGLYHRSVSAANSRSVTPPALLNTGRSRTHSRDSSHTEFQENHMNLLIIEQDSGHREFEAYGERGLLRSRSSSNRYPQLMTSLQGLEGEGKSTGRTSIGTSTTNRTDPFVKTANHIDLQQLHHLLSDNKYDTVGQASLRSYSDTSSFYPILQPKNSPILKGRERLKSSPFGQLDGLEDVKLREERLRLRREWQRKALNSKKNKQQEAEKEEGEGVEERGGKEAADVSDEPSNSVERGSGDTEGKGLSHERMIGRRKEKKESDTNIGPISPSKNENRKRKGMTGKTVRLKPIDRSHSESQRKNKVKHTRPAVTVTVSNDFRYSEGGIEPVSLELQQAPPQMSFVDEVQTLFKNQLLLVGGGEGEIIQERVVDSDSNEDTDVSRASISENSKDKLEESVTEDVSFSDKLQILIMALKDKL